MTTSAQEEQKLRKSLAGSTGSFTYHSRAEADLQLENQGRHAKGATVTGSARVPQVPRQPEGSPWHSDIVPPEEPTGIDINAQEPTGNYHEIAESVSDVASSATGDATASADEVDFHSVSSGAQVPSGVSPSSSDGTNSNVIAEPGLLRGRKL
jgi:hypothetical protein